MDGQPFFFDNNVFDDDPLAGMSDKKAPAKPEFTKDEVEQEKHLAYQNGVKDGFKQSEAALTKNILTILQKLERNMSVLFAAEDDRAKRYEEEAVYLSLSIVKKLFPVYTQEFGNKELQEAIKSALITHNTPSKIKIEIQKEMLEPLEEYIMKLEGEMQKQISLCPSTTLRNNECVISWPEGGIICSRSDISEKTFDAMKEILADRGVSVHDDDVEQTDSNQDDNGDA